MRKESINDMVDRRIIESLQMGSSIALIRLEIGTKIHNFQKVFEKDNTDVSSLMKLDFNELGPAKTRYGITYIKHSLKRIEDLRWIEKNKLKFRNFSNSQIFRLLQLRDKLSKENAISSPL